MSGAVAVAMAAAFQHLESPPPPQPGAPGEFAFADRERVHAILSGAGFNDIVIEPADLRDAVIRRLKGVLA